MPGHCWSRKVRGDLGSSHPRDFGLGPREGPLTPAGAGAWGLDEVLGSLQQQSLQLPSQLWAQRLHSGHLLWRTEVGLPSFPDALYQPKLGQRKRSESRDYDELRPFKCAKIHEMLMKADEPKL